MTNYFKMRILLLKTHKHRPKKYILDSVVKAKLWFLFRLYFPSVQNSNKAFPALPGPIFQVVFIMVFFPLQLPQGTVKIGSSDNKERGINTVLHGSGSIPAGSACLKNGDFPGTAGSTARFGCWHCPGGSGGEVETKLSSPATFSCSPAAVPGAWSNAEPVFTPVLQGIL